MKHELISSLHAVSGFVVAITGLIQIFASKGGLRHAIVGFTYLVAWLIVVVTGGVLGSALITMFGILGFYMAVTGWRMANRRKTRPKTLEKIIYWTGAVIALATFAWGVYLVILGSQMGIVALFFGLIFLTTTVIDVLDFIYKKKIRRHSGTRKQWVFEHLTRMYISYIAAMTAFTVINRVFHNDLLNWMLPTVLGTLLIIFARRHQEKSLAHKEQKEKG